MEKITFLTMMWGDKYPAQYVENIYRGIKQNTQYDFDFVCMTDQPRSHFPREIELLKFYRNPYNNGWWTKLDMFREDLPIEGKIIYLDLDMVFVDNVDWMFEMARGEEEVMLLKDAVPKNLYNSSFVKFTAGKHSYILENATKIRRGDISLSYEEGNFGNKRYWGDQIWMSEQMMENIPEHIIEVPDNEIRSFKFELGGVTNFKDHQDASIILFTGDPLPHEVYHMPQIFNNWMGEEVFKLDRERNSKRTKEDKIMEELAFKGVTYWYTDDLDPNLIVGSVGRCGSGPNTVWDDWTAKGIKNKNNMEREYIEFMNGINGHYDKLLESIERDGQLNPLLVVRGTPFRRNRNNFRYREWSMEIAKGKKYVMEGVTGGSRLWALQQLNMPTKTIIIQRGDKYPSPPPNARRLRTFADIKALYTDDVILKLSKQGNITEEFGTLKHHHLDKEPEINTREVERLIFWRELNAKHGYTLKLNPNQLKLIQEYENA